MVVGMAALDFFYARLDANSLQALAVCEGKEGDNLQAAGDGDAGQSGIVENLDSHAFQGVRQTGIFQCSAVFKCACRDAFKTIGQDDSFQALAVQEGSGTDGTQAGCVFKVDAFQFATVAESVYADGFKIVGTDDDAAQVGALLECAVFIIVIATLDFLYAVFNDDGSQAGAV